MLVISLDFAFPGQTVGRLGLVVVRQEYFPFEEQWISAADLCFDFSWFRIAAEAEPGVEPGYELEGVGRVRFVLDVVGVCSDVCCPGFRVFSFLLRRSGGHLLVIVWVGGVVV